MCDCIYEMIKIVKGRRILIRVVDESPLILTTGIQHK